MIRPSIDLERRILHVQHNHHGCRSSTLDISLDSESGNRTSVQPCDASICQSATVCGERHHVEVFTSEEIAEFFTAALNVPCTLARRQKPAGTRNVAISDKTHSVSAHSPESNAKGPSKSTLLANESPILLVSQSSVDHLNSNIQSNSANATPIPADSFRGNIVVAQQELPSEKKAPYAEDCWTSLQIGEDSTNQFTVIGPCHRCQMVCVDQQSAERRREPFSTLAKTRRRDGKVWFGMHLSPVMGKENRGTEGKRFVKVGDAVRPQS